VSRPQKSLDDAKTVHNDAASGKKTATFRLLGLTRFVSSGGGVVHTATIEPVGEKTSKFPTECAYCQGKAKRRSRNSLRASAKRIVLPKN
jgi:hypothetical protein